MEIKQTENTDSYGTTFRSFAAFRPRNKSEKAPDFSGFFRVDGKELQLAAWKKTTKNGDEYLSCCVSDVSEEYKKKLAEYAKNKE